MSCSVLQRVAVCGSVWQCVAMCCVRCGVMCTLHFVSVAVSCCKCVAVCCSVLQCVAVCCSVMRILQCVSGAVSVHLFM